MTTTTVMPVCDAATDKGCNNTGRYILEAMVSSQTAWKTLPAAQVGGNWTPMELHVCKQHLNILNRGKAIGLKPGIAPHTYNLNNSAQRALFEVEVLGQDPTTHTITKENTTMSTIEELEAQAAMLFECGAEMTQNKSQYETEEEFQAELAPVTEELNFVEKLIEERKTTMSTKKILCGHCKEYHTTPAEVAACYGVARKTSTTKLVKETEGYIRTWFATQKEAVQFIKTLGDVKKGVSPATNGHGYWTYQAKS
jgi:hypothetical protein